MSNSLVTINLVVLNGEKYIRHCLEAVLTQTYPREFIELNILDNGSSDRTKDMVREFNMQDRGFKKYKLVELTKNLGVWPGQEELLKYTDGKYVLGLCVDVILDKDFIKNAVEAMEADPKIGALEAKIYKYDMVDAQPKFTKIIDTLGFRIERSRRVTNIGHGEEDRGQYEGIREIFGVEGACPFFRREALESCKIEVSSQSEIFDHDYFWYGDDLDFVWRMNLFGWKQVFVSSVIAWHDRQTTKGLKKNWLDYIFRVPIRHQIPIKKRRLDWRNIRFTFIKNDYIINVLKDFPYILVREIQIAGYTLLFEPKVFLELPNFIRLLPRMFKKRREIMKKAVLSSREIHKYFQ